MTLKDAQPPGAHTPSLGLKELKPSHGFPTRAEANANHLQGPGPEGRVAKLWGLL